MRCIDCDTYVSDNLENESVTITHQGLEPEVNCELNQINQPWT